MCRIHHLLCSGGFLYIFLGEIVMGFRTVFVKDGDKLSLQLDNLYIRKKGDKYVIPLDDIQSIILEGHDTVITTRLLARLTKYHIPVIICDHKHMPTGIFLEIGQYHRASKRLQKQAAWKQEIKDIVWQKIVRMKIENQFEVASQLSDDIHRLNKISQLSQEVQIGDSTNREGHAAKLYFNAIYGVDFSRKDDYIENAYMDYGYAIIRSQIAKDIAASGLHPALGIFHKGEYNAFNLVDDLMEPFRPIMDWYIHLSVHDGDNFLTYEKRLQLINFLNLSMKINGRTQRIYNIMADYVNSFIKAMEEENPDVLLKIKVVEFMECEANEV